MHIAELVNQTKLQDKQIEKSFSHLLIEKNGIWGTEQLSLKKTSKSGGQSTNIFQNIKVIDLLEITSNAEGTFVNKADLSYGLIKVGLDGAIQLEDDEFFTINLTNLANNKTYNVYAIEAPVPTRVCLSVEQINISAGVSSKKQNRGTAEVLVLPSANLDSLEIQFINGQGSKYLQPELRALVGAANDIVSIEDDGVTIYGSKNLYSFNIGKANSFEVYTNGNAYNYYLLIPKEC